MWALDCHSDIIKFNNIRLGIILVVVMVHFWRSNQFGFRGDPFRVSALTYVVFLVFQSFY